MKNTYITYPYKPILLSANSPEKLEMQYKELCNLTPEQISKVYTCCMNRCSNTDSFRKVVLYNEEANEIDKVIEQREPYTNKRSLAFMCAGIGNQYLNMAYGLYSSVGYFKKLFDQCSSYLEPIIDCDIREILFNGEKKTIGKEVFFNSNNRLLLSKSRDNNSTTENVIFQTKYSHAILFSVEYCLARTLMYFGVMPDALIGHSVGEYTAIALSGVMQIKEILPLVAKRALLFEKTQSGQMTTVLANKNGITRLLKNIDGLYLATENSPTSYTISGLENAISAAEAYLDKEDILYFRVPAERAFHSEYMRPMEEDFKKLFIDLHINGPNIPIVSNVTGDWITDERITDVNSWVEHTCKTVRFSTGIRRLLSTLNPILVEIGPGQILTGFVYQQRFEGKQRTTAYSSLRDSNMTIADQMNLLILLAKLWLEGCDIKWSLFMEEKF